jgi:hypothetical protein
MHQLKFYLTALSLLITSAGFTKEYHVSQKGNDANNGSVSAPVKTISAAVKLAYAGDTITVHAGTYRESVNPLRGGESDSKRIVYRAAPGEKVEIKGSEVITGWKKEKGGVWKVTIPNAFFGDYNPYKDSIDGDWFLKKGRLHHTGEVFLNGQSLWEKETLGKVTNPAVIKAAKNVPDSLYTWYCESDEKNTTIWANFRKADPNRQLVEISTRRTCFYPDKPGINYITISGFDISQAATQWAAPTAEQVGMIATHWNKGWIIENNVIHDSKCNGITLGKERSTGHNVWSADKANVNRDGNIHYIEVVFNVLRNHWNKQTVGSHLVRNNRIFNCEQTAICGSMGAVFSTIENNHIYHIWKKRQFEGWEIAGIKFHAPIDVTIRGNHIHGCGRGIWLDWMTQGTRVSRNLLYNNDKQDLFIEVNHGPYIVDNNILLSSEAILSQSQGGAYVHNLIGGKVSIGQDLSRFTPYFLPHSIDMAGLTTIYGGDDRVYNTIFSGNGQPGTQHGSQGYNNDKLRLPVWLGGNVFYNQATPSSKDTGLHQVPEHKPEIQVLEKGGDTFLHLTLDPAYATHKTQLMDTATLGKAKVPKAAFDAPDGSPITFDTDYFGKKRDRNNVSAGPFADLKAGKMVWKVWQATK